MARKNDDAGTADNTIAGGGQIDSAPENTTGDGGNSAAAISTANAATASGIDGTQISVDETPVKKRGRGRPAGAGQTARRKTKKSSARLDISGAEIAPTLQFAHKVAANALQLPRLEISQKEALELSNAAQEVFALYDMQVSKTVAAWVKLATVATAIYMPRVLAYREMRKSPQKSVQFSEG